MTSAAHKLDLDTHVFDRVEEFGVKVNYFYATHSATAIFPSFADFAAVMITGSAVPPAIAEIIQVAQVRVVIWMIGSGSHLNTDP